VGGKKEFAVKKKKKKKRNEGKKCPDYWVWEVWGGSRAVFGELDGSGLEKCLDEYTYIL